jgi:deoxyribonuclease-4
MHHALESARRLGMEAVQVFVKNQRQWRAAPLRSDDLDRWHALRTTRVTGPVVAHATYLINLASADDVLWERSRAAFAEELQRCDVLNIPHLVIHPGAALDGDSGRGMRRVAAALNRIFEEQPRLRVRPLLETTAGQGTALGSRFEELAAIIGGVQEPQRIGVCIDTCHVFAAGYDIRDAAGYAAMVALIQRTVGLERIRCWHFNDSRAGLGSRVDRHEHIGRGQIGLAGFRHVLADARFAGVPMILETPKGLDAAGREWDRVNLRKLREVFRRAVSGR